MNFKYGFLYQGVKYGWFKKDLYRLPFTKGKRSYGLKKIHPVRLGKVYNLQRGQKTIAQMQLMTIPVDWKVIIHSGKDCPF